MSTLVRAKRAISPPIVAALVVMAIVLGFNLIYLSAPLLESASNGLSQRNLAFRDMIAESLTFLDAEVINQALNLTVVNAGGIALHVVWLWVTDTTVSPKWHGGFNVNFWLDPGVTLTNIGSTATNLDPSHTYQVKLVTARGNLFQTVYSSSKTIVSTVQGFGWVTIDWSSYFYTYAPGGSTPKPAWCVLSGKSAYQFQMKVINHYSKPVYVYAQTYLKLQAIKNLDIPFYIVASGSTAASPQPYTTRIQLPANPNDQQTGGTPVPLNFLATSPGGNSPNTIPQGQGTSPYFSVLIVFFYTDLTNNFGQTVPYQATVVQASC